MSETAVAHSNIALVKYWGKRSGHNNVPAVGSISMTIDALWSKSDVTFRKTMKNDRFFLNGQLVPGNQMIQVSAFVDRLRRMADTDRRCEINSVNNFPTAAGLASSASGYAALTVAASNSLGLHMDPTALSALARVGSGSAARSIFGGFVELPAGLDDIDSPAAVQLETEHFWSLATVIAITASSAKPISSRKAMALTKKTAPYFEAWIMASHQDLDDVRSAIRRKDIHGVGAVAEHSALKLHGLMMSARPGVLYWNPGTVEVIREVLQMREDGLAAYFTIDAGPQVKVICELRDAHAVAHRLESLSGVMDVIIAGPGPSAKLMEN